MHIYIYVYICMYGGRETERENATGPVKRNAHSPQMYRIMVKQGHHKHSSTFFVWLTEPTAGSETRRRLSFCPPLFRQSRRVWVADLLLAGMVPHPEDWTNVPVISISSQPSTQHTCDLFHSQANEGKEEQQRILFYGHEKW